MANGFLLFYLVAEFSTDAHALRYIIAVIPIVASASSSFLTWLGLRIY